MLPKLTSIDRQVLKRHIDNNPRAFYSDKTNFFISEMYDYIKKRQVWRLSIMGETRSGKSETASTICFMYKNYFNKLKKKGHFKDNDIKKNSKLLSTYLTFDIDYVRESQSDYIYTLREKHKNKVLKFGQIWQIDEDKESIGGLGSYSEDIELKNSNNIIAKFMQSEVWIKPSRILLRNSPYALYVYKKDEVNRINWSLLYKVQMTPHGGIAFDFIGWVYIPLHKNEEFRRLYNIKKNKWIDQEINGGGDKRLIERKKVAKLLSNDNVFAEMTPSGKSFKLSKSQQLTILEDYIVEGKTQNWNEIERLRIIDEARLNVMRNGKTQ